MAEDKCLIIVPPIKFVNSTLIKTDIITPNDTETIFHEIENISKILLTNYSLVDEKGVEYTLYMYKQDFYTIDNKIESYGLTIVDKTIKNITDKKLDKSNKTDFILRIGPSNLNFSTYATEYVRLYKLSRMASPDGTTEQQQSTSVAGSTKQEYEQKKRV